MINNKPALKEAPNALTRNLSQSQFYSPALIFFI